MALDFSAVWKKISLSLFFPEEKRSVFWVLVGPILLLFSAIVLLVSSAPLQALILTLAIAVLISSYFAPERIAQMFFGLVIIFSLYCLQSPSSQVIWTLQIILALYVAQQSIFSTKGFVLSTAKLRKGLEDDNHLWRTRFDTLRDKIASDRQVWESEIELAKGEVEEKVAYAQSLRRLVEAAHSQIRMLEEEEGEEQGLISEMRKSFVETIDLSAQLRQKDEKIEELEAVLTETKEKLEVLQNAYESRRSRNQELLQTNRDKPITLQSLSRKRK